MAQKDFIEKERAKREKQMRLYKGDKTIWTLNAILVVIIIWIVITKLL